MNKILSGLKKFIMIILCLAVLIGLYYLYMIKPFDEAWEEGKAIYSGKLQPNNDHTLRGRYRLDWGEPYSLAAEVKLDIRRSFVWRWGNRGSMMVTYTQEYYDTDGKLLKKISADDEWILEKIDGKWTIIDIKIPDIYPR